MTAPVRTATHSNEGIVCRLYDEVFSQGRLSVVDEIVSPDFVDHIPTLLPGQPTRGRESMRWFAQQYRAAFPDLQIAIEDTIVSDDRVVTRVTWSGTHEGMILGIDPTRRRINAMGIDIARITDGRIAEHWGQIDVLTIIAQLGFLPDIF